ncbi:lipopolysaccharide N-acetylmannosaminouronosyltransferase [Pasteurellaceae bacterium Pebbles2]|nr:lipopolysaccharide N-acetylmannosaminouronosyltransferase [Pasteurellaceae bacterium Pebbles2]
MMQKLIIRDIELLAVPNRQVFADFLMNENEIKTGLLIAINAEKVVLCDKDKELKALISQADYKYADGISLIFSLRKKFPHYQSLERIAGADLWLELMGRASELKVPTFLVGGREDVVAETSKRLMAQGVNVVGVHNGYFSTQQEKALIEEIKQSGAKFVSVAMGSPKQETFMQKAKEVYPDCLYMGVGGTYDVFVGRVKRAPLLWRKMNLEWLYRLLSQPTRWQRQVNLLRYAYYYFTNKL